MIPARLPLSESRRQRLRDDRLWIRESQRATELNVQRLHCPCTNCRERKRLCIRNVREHLIRNGRHPECRMWRGPGARDSSDEEWEHEFWELGTEEPHGLDAAVDTRGMLDQACRPVEDPTYSAERVQDEVRDAFATADSIHEEFMEVGVDDAVEEVECRDEQHTPNMGTDMDDSDNNFDAKVLEESLDRLYEGARSSKLAATVLLMNLCTVHGVTNQCANELFSILHSHLLPENNTLPKSHHAAKTLTGKLGLTYNTIHACERGCVLFRGPHENALRCPKCGGRRYKDEDRRCFPVKVLRHFPIVPRLQRMFMSPSISKLMVWHAENRSNKEGGDGLVRHPCDSKAWQHFEENVDISFANDARNVHFALAADGVNPYKQNKSSWSTWPVVLLNYNLPPWLSTKKFFIMLALLIPGKESVTADVFDVYLEPLVDELLELWAGVPAHDVSKDAGSRAFQLRGMLLWTIHDFPGYGTVGGFSHQGYAACPWCGEDLGAQHSTELGKQTYGGTRRWLPEDHPYRSEEMKSHFDGFMETRPKPRTVTVDEQIRHALECEAWREAGNRDGAAGDPSKIYGVKRLSSLYRLPYWKLLLIRWTLDVMHCELNLAKNFLKTITGKKDTVKVRRDLQRRNVRPHLWLTPHPRKAGKMVKPRASYVLADDEFEKFAKCIESLKTPSGYSSDLAKCIRKKNFGGLKSHDYHVLMQQVMPLALRGLMQPGPRMAVMRMCKVFRRLCTKVYNPVDFPSLEADVAESLALLEIEFPPSFFDVMTHLPLHLAKELDLCGPVSARWMYPVERYMKVLKNHVRNMARPEASMAEGYLKDECIGFITEYIHRFEATQRRIWDEDEEYGDAEEVMQGSGRPYVMSPELRDVAHQYVLSNTTTMADLVEKWTTESQANPSTPALADWIQRTVQDSNLDLRDPENMDLFLLSKKPAPKATRYARMIAFGNHFRVEDDTTKQLLSYNSGVASVFQEPSSVAEASSVNYVGVLKDILQLDYGAVTTKIVLMRCEWVKPQDSRGNLTYTRDESGFLVVNFRHKLPRMAEPFIFSSQVTQVFFSDVADRPGWKVVLRKEARARRIVVDTADAFISTRVESTGLRAPERFAVLAQTVNLVGAIELSEEENLLAQEGY